VTVLCRHLGLTKADDDVHRLAFSITGLAIHMFISREVVDAIRPQLFGAPDAVEQWAASLVAYSEAMVAVDEARRKHSPDHPAAGKPRLKTAHHE
jgi:hypothetical protein